MNAIRIHKYGGPEVLRLEEIPTPEPGPGEVLVQMRAAGVNPVDTYLRSGAQGYAPDLPFTPGMDGAGEVAAVGGQVDDLRAGQRVYVARSMTGTYAEMALCRREHVFSLPEGISFEEGACLGVPYGTAMRAIVDRAELSYGETVLVHGASGGVGTAAVQIARALGGRVAGTAGTDAGRELVREQGAEATFDHGDGRHLYEALEWTGGRGFDVVLEMAAERNLGEVLKVLAPGGRVVVIGSRGDVGITPRDLMKREAQVMGMSLMNARPGEFALLHVRIRLGLERGELKPVLREEMPLAEAATAHERVMESGAQGQIVLRIG
jgi:NADPH:quinone reductase